jgi:DnaJ-class molecular chaperone
MARKGQCPRCLGERVVVRREGRNRFEETCPKCKGTGKVPKEDQQKG